MSTTRFLEAHKLTLLCRLEAATSRLEDMVPNYGNISGSTDPSLPSPDAGTGAVAGTDQTRANAPQEHLVEPLPPAIEDFDAIVNEEVKTFVNMSEDIGGLVAEQVNMNFIKLAE
jgi:adenylyl cyclase-associated protein